MFTATAEITPIYVEVVRKESNNFYDYKRCESFTYLLKTLQENRWKQLPSIFYVSIVTLILSNCYCEGKISQKRHCLSFCINKQKSVFPITVDVPIVQEFLAM